MEIEENDQNVQKQLIKNLFKLFIKHGWTLKSLEDTAKLMNVMPGATINVPTTKYLLIKELLSVSNIIASQHFLCDSCNKYTKADFRGRQKVKKCVYCQKELNAQFFVSFNLNEQIARVIDEHFDDIEKFLDSMKSKVNITDIYSSGYTKKLMARTDNIYSLTLNTDGVAIVQSNSASLWPVLVTCNFLPPQIRFKDKNIFVAALFYGKEKPKIHELFRPLAEEMEILSKGIFVREKFFNIFITNASLDLPAKCEVAKMVQFNSKHACNFCLQEGQSTSKGIRYTYKSQPHTLRTHESIINDMVKVNSNPELIIHGVKGVSPMVAFKHFDLAKSFCIDYMHAVLLGVTKKIIGFWTLSTYHKQPFYINKTRQKILNFRLSKIKNPSYISRRPRSLKFFHLFKASELRNLLLYYIPIITENILPQKYIEHIKLLSSSIYTLLKPDISNSELDQVEEKLTHFVREYQRYYGKINMTMNVHSLLHLVDCVRNFGPMWTFSMFTFESYNALLKSFVVAPTDVLHQIMVRYLCFKTIEDKQKVEALDSYSLKTEIKYAPLIHHIAAIKEAGLNDNEVKYYARLEKNHTVFTSKAYNQAKKTFDYFVETSNKKFGAIETYFSLNSECYAIIEVLDVVQKEFQFKKIVFSKKYVAIKVDEIVERCVNVEVLKQNFIVKRPNTFERN